MRLRSHAGNAIPGAVSRPRERVLAYLETTLSRPGLRQGERLPTVRHLARRLRVSTSAVQAALREFSRQGRIRTQVGNGSFIMSVARVPPAEYRLMVGLHPVELATGPYSWGARIFAALMAVAHRHSDRILLAPLACDMLDEAAALRKYRAAMAQAAGLFIMPFPCLDPIREEYEAGGKPVIYLNQPSETAVVNFVSFDYFHAAERLGRVWRECGRRRIVMLANMPLASSISIRLRHLGLMAGLGLGTAAGRDIVYRVEEAEDVTEEAGFAAMRRILKTGSTPDAICCAGDYLALGVLRALAARRITPPDQISVAGGTGLDLAGTICPRLTRTLQPLEAMGTALVGMLLDRLHSGANTLPGVILPTPWIGGATTTVKENEGLELADDLPPLSVMALE